MFNRILNNKSSFKEYINFEIAGYRQAFGLYIRALQHDNEPYCYEAKHRMFLCLDYIHQFLDETKLVAIYVDIISDQESETKGFDQMIQDINAGTFSKFLTFDLIELMNDVKISEKIHRLSQQIEQLESFDLSGNLLHADSIPLNQLLGV